MDQPGLISQESTLADLLISLGVPLPDDDVSQGETHRLSVGELQSVSDLLLDTWLRELGVSLAARCKVAVALPSIQTPPDHLSCVDWYPNCLKPCVIASLEVLGQSTVGFNAPSIGDIKEMTNLLALSAALVWTVAVALPASVDYTEMEKAIARFDTGGIKSRTRCCCCYCQEVSELAAIGTWRCSAVNVCV